MAKCSFCKQEGHNILKCDEFEKYKALKLIKKLVLYPFIFAALSFIYVIVKQIYADDKSTTMMDFLSTLGNGIAIGFEIGFGVGVFFALFNLFNLDVFSVFSFVEQVFRKNK